MVNRSPERDTYMFADISELRKAIEELRKQYKEGTLKGNGDTVDYAVSLLLEADEFLWQYEDLMN